MINSHYIPQFILRNFYDDGMITIEGTANMGVLCSLKGTDWFIENVAMWIFYDSEGWGEDMLEHYHM